MKTKYVIGRKNLLNSIVLGAALLYFGTSSVQAAPISLDSSLSCIAGNAINGIAVTDVTGNNGVSDECWGTYDGNDPGPSGDGFLIGTQVFDFVAKEDTPGGLSGADIGLDVNPDGGVPSGTWEFDPNLFDPSEFLIVLKAANTPGFAAWLFTGTSAASTSGTWGVAWTNPNNNNPRDLSHLSIYAHGGTIPPPPPPQPGPVPEPAPLALLALGGMLLGWKARKSRA